MKNRFVLNLCAAIQLSTSDLHNLLSCSRCIHFPSAPQRFGVKQKEKIASFKTSVDVLTLSATPIPRTLYLALTGFRDAR